MSFDQFGGLMDMTAITEKIRSQGFSIVECDVPPQLTLGAYRPLRTRRQNRRAAGLLSRRRTNARLS